MAALTAGRKGTIQDGDRALPDIMSFPVKANVHIYQGALVVLSSGYAAPASTATGLIVVGVAEAEVDNTGGSDGALRVRVKRGSFTFANSSSGDAIAQTDAGADCYCVDDQTVAKTNGSSTRSRAGKIMGVDALGVHVLIGIGI